MDYANALEPFKQVSLSTPKPNAMTAMAELDQNRGCRLGYAADMLMMLSTGLRRMENVQSYVGHISGGVHSDSRWSVNVDRESEGQVHCDAKMLVLATGSKPKYITLPTSKPTNLDLDLTLDRAQLRKTVPRDQPTTIGIVGTSHSAVVVIMNLYELATSTHRQLKIKWFVRSDLTYAQEMDGWILRDNTGLKGASAEFAKEHLEPDRLPHSPVGKYLTQVHCPDAASPDMKPELETCNYIVQAIGFVREPIPELRPEGTKGKVVNNVHWSHETGELLEEPWKKGEMGNALPNAYGAGIAFPEGVTDPFGNREQAGMFSSPYSMFLCDG
jgi:hypothetical protein